MDHNVDTFALVCYFFLCAFPVYVAKATSYRTREYSINPPPTSRAKVFMRMGV